MMRATAWMAMLGLLGLASVANAEEVYKWVDKDGKVHYGDYSPDGKSQVIQTPTAPPTSNAPAEDRLEKQKKMLEESNEKNIKQREAKEKSAKEQKEAAERCGRAKGRLATLESAGRIQTAGPDGTLHFVDDAERAQMLAEARANIKKFCK